LLLRIITSLLLLLLSLTLEAFALVQFLLGGALSDAPMNSRP